MINKEIILGNGNIVKDFSDRNIPQNSHNQVCVSFLIPSNQFNDYDDYSVFTGVSRIVGGSETTLNSLVLTASKSITIEGINYIKFSCVLSIDYTNVLGELRFSPYIQGTRHTDSVLEDSDSNGVDEVITETLLDQFSYTNCKLNVIKAVRIQEDASLEQTTIATTLAGQINSKKIYYNAEWNSISVGNENTLYYNIANGYNPSVALYNGSIVAIKNQNVVSFYFPYLNDSAVELLKMTNDGLFYKISGISRTGEGTEQSPYVYNATKQQLTYTKAEIDTKESAIYDALDSKVDKTQKVNGHALSGDITLTKGDVGLGDVSNMSYETTPTITGENLYITSKGVYDALQVIYGILDGKVDDADLTSIENRLNSIEAIIGSDSGDADSVINTLKEVIVVLNGLGEGANLLDLINAKANQTEVDAISDAVDVLEDKMEIVYARNNAYMEIKNSTGTIDIAVNDWIANTGDTNYPYKWELTNGYLEGAVNCIVVYSKDSDTSMLSATTGIDEVNGKLIIYASEIPSDVISIEKIAVFNDLNAYINYSNEIVQQVLSNTDAISDINNTKLPLYELKQESLGTNKGTKTQGISSGYWSQRVKRLNYGETKIEQSYDEIALSYIDNLDQTTKIVIKSDTGYNEGLIKLQNHTHTLQLDHNGLTLDGVAVGGGSQKYQHCITLIISGTKRFISLNVINDDSTPFTYNTLKTYLSGKGFDNSNVVYSASGTYYESGYGLRIVYGVFGSTEINVVGTTIDAGLRDYISIAGATITDTVIAL